MVKEENLQENLPEKLKGIAQIKILLVVCTVVHSAHCDVHSSGQADYQITLTLSQSAKSRFNYKIIEVRNK